MYRINDKYRKYLDRLDQDIVCEKINLYVKKIRVYTRLIQSGGGVDSRLNSSMENLISEIDSLNRAQPTDYQRIKQSLNRSTEQVRKLLDLWQEKDRKLQIIQRIMEINTKQPSANQQPIDWLMSLDKSDREYLKLLNRVWLDELDRKIRIQKFQDNSDLNSFIQEIEYFKKTQPITPIPQEVPQEPANSLPVRTDEPPTPRRAPLN